jgi:hypothetical protein
MPIHIGQLISNVNVGRSSESRRTQTTAMPALDLVLRQSSEESAVPGQADPTVGTSDNATPPPAVDPKALAERVYRLLLDEAAIARERE